ncbi:phage baseplate assembly protein W [Actinoplanes octamycinicus]|uniref:Phage baseplate assembly protein W n=1 Tax=Actinoplanes octamycinicus TaxID=135948 RepID=A0A7W7H4Y6_9ACTN|nr:GPW/gp25 family protein [Actinoplanes octamycinicus]MBB4744073.1 phage baseplate assembly protein W [Actinoplanes octamycinicus]GIE56970.1 baseplate protein [Actinoplanes octamycinicus]
MTADFTGVGWKFPIQLDERGRVVRVSGEDSVREAIWLILSTAPGERAMRPGFGCGVHDLVFGISNAATAGLVEARVRDALVRWEPRIDLLDVRAGSAPDSPATLLIQIDYRLRATNTVFNLVYPFYLDPGVAP